MEAWNNELNRIEARMNELQMAAMFMGWLPEHRLEFAALVERKTVLARLVPEAAAAIKTAAEYEALWSAGNNAGHGFAGCICHEENCGCDINDLPHLGKLILADRDLAVYLEPNGGQIAVRNAHGPWAIRIA